MGKKITIGISVLFFVLLMMASTDMIYSQEARNGLRESNLPGQRPLPVGRMTNVQLHFSPPGRQFDRLNPQSTPALPPFAKKLQSSIFPSHSADAEFYVIDTVTVISTYDTTRYTFGHNASGSVISISVKKWTNGQWVDSCRYMYGASGYELTEVFEQWSNSQWLNVDSVTYTFDGYGNELTQLNEEWINGQWTNDWLYTYTYDANERFISSLSEQWTNGQWVNSDRLTYTYNSNEQFLSVLGRTMDKRPMDECRALHEYRRCKWKSSVGSVQAMDERSMGEYR